MPPAQPPPPPPLIFAPARRIAVRRRMRMLQAEAQAPRYIFDDMIEDVLERIAFVRVTPQRVLTVGDLTGRLNAHFAAVGAEVTATDPADGFDEERPIGATGYDLIVSLGTLDTVNDLPGALIHLREALAPGGLMIASMLGAGSGPTLRAVMLAADGERPGPRIHPQIDVRAGAQLLQRAGFSDPVADSRALDVRFGSLTRLVGDLRAQGLSNVLAQPGPPLGRAALTQAKAAFADTCASGRTAEHFEIITLSGWRRP